MRRAVSWAIACTDAGHKPNAESAKWRDWIVAKQKLEVANGRLAASKLLNGTSLPFSGLLESIVRDFEKSRTLQIFVLESPLDLVALHETQLLPIFQRLAKLEIEVLVPSADHSEYRKLDLRDPELAAERIFKSRPMVFAPQTNPTRRPIWLSRRAKSPPVFDMGGVWTTWTILRLFFDGLSVERIAAELNKHPADFPPARAAKTAADGKQVTWKGGQIQESLNAVIGHARTFSALDEDRLNMIDEKVAELVEDMGTLRAKKAGGPKTAAPRLLRGIDIQCGKCQKLLAFTANAVSVHECMHEDSIANGKTYAQIEALVRIELQKLIVRDGLTFWELRNPFVNDRELVKATASTLNDEFQTTSRANGSRVLLQNISAKLGLDQRAHGALSSGEALKLLQQVPDPGSSQFDLLRLNLLRRISSISIGAEQSFVRRSRSGNRQPIFHAATVDDFAPSSVTNRGTLSAVIEFIGPNESSTSLPLDSLAVRSTATIDRSNNLNTDVVTVGSIEGWEKRLSQLSSRDWGLILESRATSGLSGDSSDQVSTIAGPHGSGKNGQDADTPMPACSQACTGVGNLPCQLPRGTYAVYCPISKLEPQGSIHVCAPRLDAAAVVLAKQLSRTSSAVSSEISILAFGMPLNGLLFYARLDAWTRQNIRGADDRVIRSIGCASGLSTRIPADWDPDGIGGSMAHAIAKKLEQNDQLRVQIMNDLSSHLIRDLKTDDGSYEVLGLALASALIKDWAQGVSASQTCLDHVQKILDEMSPGYCLWRVEDHPEAWLKLRRYIVAQARKFGSTGGPPKFPRGAFGKAEVQAISVAEIPLHFHGSGVIADHLKSSRGP